MLFPTSQGLPIYGTTSEDFVPPPPPPLGAAADAATESASDYLLYSLYLLKEKVHQVESLVAVFIPPPQTHPIPATAIASLGTLIQDIIATASSMIFSSQQMALATTTSTGHHHNLGDHDRNKFSQSLGEESGQIFYAPHPDDNIINTLAYYYNTRYDNNGMNNQQTDIAFSDDGYSCNRNKEETMEVEQGREVITREEGKSKDNQRDIIEVEAAAIMAKYTHYCRVCGKGFKRDANLRMHMRAHGEEYKSRAALIKPVSAAANNSISGKSETRMMYSCPHEGCRWNLRHAKFQPLKSMICVKNHYRRSHCPKMYVCRRCNRKHFSVLSDLRTHEKHCGDVKWRCSCGTTFSRKDKLIGHVSLFVGHTPATDTDIIGPVAAGKLSS